MIPVGDVGGDCFSHIFIVRVAGQASALDHIHPGFAILDQAAPECQAKDIPAAVQVGFSLALEIILYRVPRKFG
jgi:hypothetical protein